MIDQRLSDDVQLKECIERQRLLKLWEWIFRFGTEKHRFLNYTLTSPSIDTYYSSYDFSMLRFEHKTKEFKMIIGEYKNRIKLDADKFDRYKKEGILLELQKVKLTDFTKAGCLVWYLCEFNEGLFLADITDIHLKNYPIVSIECRANNTYFDTRWKDCHLIPFDDGIFFPRNKENQSLDLIW